MDSNMILTWSIIILATITLIVYFWIRNRKREKNTFSVLQNFALENDCVISSYDHWDKTLIGIDNKESNKLFFIRTTPNQGYRKAINLSEVMSCRMVKAERTVTYKKEKVHVIDRIDLIFSFVKTEKPAVVLEFYNTDYDRLTLSGELQLAQKWSGIVNSFLVTNQNRKKEARKGKIKVTPGINEVVGHTFMSANALKGKAKYATHAI